MRCTHSQLTRSIEGFSHASTDSHFQQNDLSHLITQKFVSKLFQSRSQFSLRNSSNIFPSTSFFFFFFLLCFVFFLFFVVVVVFCVFVSFCFCLFFQFFVFVFFFLFIIILLLPCCFVAYLLERHNRYLRAYKHSSSRISYRCLHRMWHQTQFTSDNKCVIIHQLKYISNPFVINFNRTGQHNQLMPQHVYFPRTKCLKVSFF